MVRESATGTLVRLSGRLQVGLAALMVAVAPGCKTASRGAALHIEAPEQDHDADVYIDGQYVGVVGELRTAGLAPIMLAPGKHTVEIRKEGRFAVQKTVEVTASTPSDIVVEAVLLEDPAF